MAALAERCYGSTVSQARLRQQHRPTRALLESMDGREPGAIATTQRPGGADLLPPHVSKPAPARSSLVWALLGVNPQPHLVFILLGRAADGMPARCLDPQSPANIQQTESWPLLHLRLRSARHSQPVSRVRRCE